VTFFETNSQNPKIQGIFQNPSHPTLAWRIFCSSVQSLTFSPTALDPMLENNAIATNEVQASNDPVQDETAVESIRSNLEGVKEGCIFGWVHDDLNPSETLRVGIYENGTVLGETVANQHRNDLEDAGVGNGYCAFSMMLPDHIFDGMKHELSVVELESGTTIGSICCEVPAFASSAIETIRNSVLRGQIKVISASRADAFVIEVLVDGNVLLECSSRRTKIANIHSVEVKLPSTLFDDNYHLYELRVKNKSTRSDPLYVRLDSITTEWKHIGGSFANENFSAIPKISAYRYSALQTHMRNLDSANYDINTLKNVQLAHDIIAEGLVKRKHYPTLTLPAIENPDVSVVLPVHNAFEYTYNCIASLILSYNKYSFEVILVDDESSDQTINISVYINNLTVIKNDTNLGFLRTAEKGAMNANGDFIVFLNNDTETTTGWIDNLVDVFQRFDNVGMAGSKLIYPNGNLQEAGGLVWGNGKPWNVGNGGNAEDPIYNYVRQADYVSGAAMMVKKSVWETVGGFSKEFIPAYYEDTDLAFKIRQAGYKTLYVPSSVVVHYEGMSNGRDLDSGYKRYQTLNSPLFRQKWRHSYRQHGVYGKNIEYECDRDKDFRILMVDHSTPKPDQDAGSYAVAQEMRLLQELGCKITFVPNNVSHMGKYTTALQNEGVECLYAPFIKNVGEVLRDRGHEFDLVYITRYTVAEEIIEYVRKYTQAKVVLNNCDLHFLREMRAAANGDDFDIAAAMNTRQRELAVMEEVDAILSYNDTEHSVISSHTFEANKIFKCPWVLSEKQLKVPFIERKGISFLGGFNHLPNREAVIYFVNEVMPLIRQKSSEIVFNVYGSGVTEEIEALAADDIHIKGFVESLDTVFEECRVFVAPLLSGAGIKGKVLESISYQVPCVLSPIAAESTGLIHDLNSKIAETPMQWADYIVSLYNDENEWNRLSQKSSELVTERYSIEHGLEAMAKMMSHLELDPSSTKDALFRAA
jgi:GT2 family glycosyltransferase/glycosyltransferase involved in cell wall biosynthesis